MNGKFIATNASNRMPPVMNTHGLGRASASTAITTRITAKTTSGGMNPMLNMVAMVINASMIAAIGISHMAVLLPPDATTAFGPPPSDRGCGTVP